MDGWVTPEVLVFAEQPDRMGVLCASLVQRGYSVALVRWREGEVSGDLVGPASAVLVQVADVSQLCPQLIRELIGQAGARNRVVVVGAGGVEDRVRLLHAGADVCLPPTLSDSELLARVLAILRQAGIRGRRMVLREGQLTVDLARRAAAYRGRRLLLSHDEYHSLRELALRVMESRSRFGARVGDDRLTTALRQLRDYADRLEHNTQSSMMEDAGPPANGEEAGVRSARA